MSNSRHLFTSESVSMGHPDKVADAISDAVLDMILDHDAWGRCACETLVTTAQAVVAGEIKFNHNPKKKFDVQQAVRDTILRIGKDFAGKVIGVWPYENEYEVTAAIKAAGKAEPAAIQKALWDVKHKGVYGDIAFIKQGPAGKESAQNVPAVYLVTIKDGKVAKLE